MKKDYYKQDNIYLKKDNGIQIKEIYKETKKIIENRFNDCRNLDILDVGTASGELLYFLKKELKIQKKLYGIEKSRELVQNAIDRFGDENIEFLEDDANTFELKKQFDVIILFGVITIFDDFKPCINNLMRHLNKGGIVIIGSIFNDYDIDVRIKFRMKDSEVWNTGYNLFPISDVKDFIKNLGCDLEVLEHTMPFDIEKQENPLRAWTVNLDGNRFLMNGLNLIYRTKILVIKK